MVTHTIGNKIIVFLILLLIGVTNMYAFGAGIFYPKIIFSFDNLDENFYWGAADKACDSASESTPEINVLFRQPGNSFKAEFFPVFLTKKNYAKLYIKSITYIYENKEFTALEDAVFILPEKIIGMDSNEIGWITNGTYYWLNGWTAKCENPNDKSKKWPETNFEKIFKNKKAGDNFPFSIKIIYNFDEEDEKTLLILFTVIAIKGWYTSIFAGS